MFGEPTFAGSKSTFDGINPPEGTVEGNAICGNTKFIAVSKLFVNILILDALEKWRRRIGGCAPSNLIWKNQHEHAFNLRTQRSSSRPVILTIP